MASSSSSTQAPKADPPKVDNPKPNPPEVAPPKPDPLRVDNDPQTWQVPKQIHFVWMGTRPVQVLGEKGADADGKFRAPQVLANAVINKDCMPVLWLDLFTMASRDDLRRAFDPDLYAKYTRWSRLALATTDRNYLAPGQVDPQDPTVTHELCVKNDMKLPRDPGNYLSIITMLRQAREKFSTWVQDDKNKEVFFKRQPLVDIMKYTPTFGDHPLEITPEIAQMYPAFAGMKEVRSDLKVQFLDIDIYPRWMSTLPRTPDWSLVNWVLFELYFRRSNFGAASDLIRIQLLLDQGGIYVDHDDHIPWLHDPKRPIIQTKRTVDGKEVIDDAHYRGFRYAAFQDLDGVSPVNSFFAAPPGHPFLKFYREKVLADYQTLLEKNYKWESGTPADVSWFDFERGWDKLAVGRAIHKNFADFTIKVSGPSQVKKCLLAARYALCTTADQVAKLQDEDDVAAPNGAERMKRAQKTLEDSKEFVKGWIFGTDLFRTGRDNEVAPGTAGAWAI